MALSRRKVAQYAAQLIKAGESQEKVQHLLAAYIIDAKAQRSVHLLVAEIEKILADEYGHVSAHITSAYSLGDSLKKQVAHIIGAHASLEITSSVNPDLLGGVIVETPGKEFDGSVMSNIKKLKTIGS